MIDYNEIQRMTDQGIADFSDGASFEVILTAGGVKIVDGEEVKIPEERGTVYGGVRAISYRYVDGVSIMAGDKRAFFSNVTPLKDGMIVIIDGQHWRIVDTRPVNPSQNHVIAYRPILRKVAKGG